MSNVDYNVPFAVHPGVYIKMELEGRNVKQKDFAEVLGISKVEVSNLIKGKRNITPRLAVRIGEAFGTGPETWINMQTMYDLWILKQNKTEVQEWKIIPKRMSVFYPQASETFQRRTSLAIA